MDMNKKAWNMEVENLWRPQMSMKMSPNERASFISPWGARQSRKKDGGKFKFEQETMEIFKKHVWT